MAWGPLSIGGSVSGYTLPAASASVLGGVKTGDNITNKDGTISLTKENVNAALGYTAADQTHTHDDRYYTESEINAKLAGKSDTGHGHNAATQSTAGFMSAADKKKLDGVAAGANAYTLPTATASVLGGVKTGANITNSGGTLSVTKANVTNALGYTPANASHTHDDRYYTESEINAKLAGKSDTGHGHNAATQSTAGFMSAADKAKLDGIARGANAYVLTKAAVVAVLGYDPAEKLKRLERMMNMDGKLVYTGIGTASGSRTKSMAVPGSVDYILVRMAIASRSESTGSGGAGVGVAADYGTTRIVRGGTARALVANNMVSSISFAGNGTLTIGQTGDGSGDYQFNVEGYQYV